MSSAAEANISPAAEATAPSPVWPGANAQAAAGSSSAAPAATSAPPSPAAHALEALRSSVRRERADTPAASTENKDALLGLFTLLCCCCVALVGFVGWQMYNRPTDQKVNLPH